MTVARRGHLALCRRTCPVCHVRLTCVCYLPPSSPLPACVPHSLYFFFGVKCLWSVMLVVSLGQEGWVSPYGCRQYYNDYRIDGGRKTYLMYILEINTVCCRADKLHRKNIYIYPSNTNFIISHSENNHKLTYRLNESAVSVHFRVASGNPPPTIALPTLA